MIRTWKLSSFVVLFALLGAVISREMHRGLVPPDMLLTDPVGVALVVQAGECFSRRADIVVVMGALPIRTVLVLGGKDLEGDDLWTILDAFPHTRVVQLPKADTPEIVRAGLAHTPGLLRWTTSSNSMLAVPLSTNRAELYEQVRATQSSLSLGAQDIQ